MRNATWADLEPDSAPYAEVAVDRKITNTLRRTREDAESRTDALYWLCHNAGHSLMGHGAPQPDAPLVRAVVLTEPLHLQMPDNRSCFLPSGTDIRAVYADGSMQQLYYDLPDPALGVRAVPPFCTRMHNGQPLLPDSDTVTHATFTIHGQLDALVATRQLALAAGAKAHVADIDRRLLVLAQGQRRLAS